jgi:TolA-binding protein
MKTWDWWVPYVAAFLGWLGTYLLNRRSDSFKELTEVKNAYKMRVEELGKRLEQLEPKVEELQKNQEQSKLKIRQLESDHQGCQDLLHSTNKALEYAKKQGQELFNYLKEFKENGASPDGIVS